MEDLLEPSLLGQQVLVSASINFGSFLALPDCSTLNYSAGATSRCMAFCHHFLLIWWLNFILCSLSLTLSFDYRHSVLRSLIVFILTVWEFTFYRDSPGWDPIMLGFVLLFRSAMFSILILDILFDVDFRHCIKHISEELIISFFDFYNNYVDVVGNIPGLLQLIHILTQISKSTSYTNI